MKKNLSFLVASLVLCFSARSMPEFEINESSELNECPMNFEACIDQSCRELSSLHCKDFSELKLIKDACVGNYDGNCVRVVCEYAGSLGCRRVENVLNVATACRWNNSGRCVDQFCRRMGPLRCKNLDQLIPIAEACAVPPTSRLNP